MRSILGGTWSRQNPSQGQSNDLLQFKIHSGIDLIIFHEFVI
jgi:hypothetical protein